MTSMREQRHGCNTIFDCYTGHREQCVDVRFAAYGSANNLSIYNFFAGDPDPGKQPPDGRMKPEDYADQFFYHCSEPVVSPNMQEFMTHNSPLGILFQQEKGFR